jgi:hypothetical protein
MTPPSCPRRRKIIEAGKGGARNLPALAGQGLGWLGGDFKRHSHRLGERSTPTQSVERSCRNVGVRFAYSNLAGWEGKSTLGTLKIAVLWTVLLILGQKKDEEEEKGKRSLAEIIGLKFPMDRKDDDEQK